jgi:predicted ferric reductase
MKYAARGAFWCLLYLTVVILPLVFAALGPFPAGRGFWREFSVALGFVGLSMWGLEYVLVARIRPVAAPFGEDAIIWFHRLMGYPATLFILLHPFLLIVAVSTRFLQQLNPFTASWAGRTGTFSIVLVLILIVTSVWRRQLRIRYEWWQAAHVVLATAAIVLALAHIELIGRYVGEPWKRALWAAMTAAFVGVIVWVRIVRPIMRIRRPWTVESVVPERGQSWTVTLRPVGHPGFAYAPGEFGWLSINRSPFSFTQHPFSFSSSPERDGRIQMTIKELGDFTRTVGSITPGARAYLDGPHGTFSPDRYEGPAFALLAGGIGIAPMMSMLRTFADRGERRVCVLLYGNRDFEDAMFGDELKNLKQKLALEVVHVVEEPPAGWQGERGRIDADLLRRHLSVGLQRMQYFICGPEPFQDAMEYALASLGVPGERVHTERFNWV